MKKFFSLALILHFSSLIFAQLVVTPYPQSYTPSSNGTGGNITTFVQNNLIGPGITISNVTFQGANRQIAAFDATNTQLYTAQNMKSGLMLSTGICATAIGPNDVPWACATPWAAPYANTSGGYIGNQGVTGSDNDLANIVGTNVQDKAILEFDFQPNGSTVEFNYIFGSEEYPEYVGQFNDGFGLFLSGPGISGSFSNQAINFATIPSTTLPVTIDNINANTNSSYYVYNGDPNGSATVNPYKTQNQYIQYDGYTVKMTAKMTGLQCGQTYHIKIAIADARDQAYDSGLFLEKGSFISSGSTVGISANPTDISIVRPVNICIGDSISIGSTLQGAPTGGTYNWLGMGVQTEQGTATTIVKPTVTTQYTVQYTYSSTSGCTTGTNTIQDTITVHVNPLPSIDAGTNDSICSGSSVGLTANGGSNYSWTPTQGLSSTSGSTVSASPTSSTQYIVVGTDSHGCSNKDSVMVVVNGKATIQNPVPGACNAGKYDVSGTVSITNAPNSGNLILEDCQGNQTIVASAPFSQTSYPFTLNGLNADGNSCNLTAYFSVSPTCKDVVGITAPAPCGGCTPPSLTVKNLIFCNGNIADLDSAVVSVGTANISYYSSASNANSGTNAIDDSVATAGSYWIRAENPSDPTCYTVKQINVQMNTVQFTSNVVDATCSHSDGSITLTSLGGTQPYNYSIDNGTNFQVSGIFNSLAANSYQIVIKDSVGCQANGSVVVNNIGAPTVNVSPQNPLCYGQCNGKATAVITGGTVPYSITWKDSLGNTIGTIDSVNNLCVGQYQIEVKDNNGCLVNTTTTLTNPIQVEASFSANPLVAKIPNTSVQFQNLSSGASKYTWDFGDNSNVDHSQNPNHAYPSDTTGSYNVVLIAINGNGCSDTAQVVIHIIKDSTIVSEYKLPNVFTPNADDANDIFEFIYSYNLEKVEIIILNRWGNEVFKSNEIAFQWNGKDHNNGEECTSGVYFYKMKVKGLDGKTSNEQGFVHLVRDK